MKICKIKQKVKFTEEDYEGAEGLNSGVLGGNIHGGDITNTDFYAPDDNRVPSLLFKKPLKRKKKLFENVKASNLGMYDKTLKQQRDANIKTSMNKRVDSLIVDFLTLQDLEPEDRQQVEELMNTMSASEAFVKVVTTSPNRYFYLKLADENSKKANDEFFSWTHEYLNESSKELADIDISLGTFKDVKYVYNLMNERDKKFIVSHLEKNTGTPFYIIAKNKNIPVGFIFGIMWPDEPKIITFIGIDPKFRGYGISNKLFKAYIEKCKKENIKKILWWCDKNNKSSEALIKKFGGKLVNQKEIKSSPNAYRRFELSI